MGRSLLQVVCLSLLILVTFADVEYEAHGHDHHHHHAHDGHDHHDHEAHSQLFTGEATIQGDETEQREKLRDIASRIDINQDGKISRDEMHAYVGQRIKDQHAREGDDFITTLDPKKSEKITFTAYVRDNYGDLDTNEIEKGDKTDSRLRETRRTYLADKQKWAHLDKDGDQALSHADFRTFLRPEDDEALRKIEISSIISEYDDNTDGKLSNDEYLKMTEAETGEPEPLGDEIDKNKDGFGDFDEFAHYYLPTSSVTIEEETDHLLKECDKNKDGYCSADEIVQAYSSFAGSQITDFGADLETAKEEL